MALALVSCCALAPGLLTACAKDPAPPEANGTLPTQLAVTPTSSELASPTSAEVAPSASAAVSLSPELAAQKATALAMPKPPMPAEATENTQQGAVRAAVRFFELYRYAFMTGDTTDLAAMSEDRCVFCKSAIDDATALHKSGGWANLWTLRITNIEYNPPGEGKEYCGIRFTVISDESTSVNRYGEEVKDEAEESRLFMILRYQDGMWHVGGVSLN
ncbi:MULTISPECIES: DUF6318 family protein [Actinomyces]|uniref:DUF6318 domain-containing protein n=1 Tax=Actinomyces marmotae TaxID=2737173 RepID=A0A6M8B077_9ACTO|nr:MULTISPECIES: DUF6318 family protein [Actinomyces]QKD79112.1 hypothetical protein HPC72_01525 [Actinomyces marmotae]